jgi:hypothetical protein
VEDNKMGLKGIGWDGIDWIDVAQDSVEGSCVHGNEPSDSVKYWEVRE